MVSSKIHLSCISRQFNTLSDKKQTTKGTSTNFQKMLSPSCIILRIQRQMANCVDLDEVAQYETPHHDLCCLQIPLFSSLVFKVLIKVMGGVWERK